MKKACKSCHGKGDLESNENSASWHWEELSQPWICSEPRQAVVLNLAGHFRLGAQGSFYSVGRESLRVIGVKLAMFSETLGQTLLLADKRV